MHGNWIVSIIRCYTGHLCDSWSRIKFLPELVINLIQISFFLFSPEKKYKLIQIHLFGQYQNFTLNFSISLLKLSAFYFPLQIKYFNSVNTTFKILPGWLSLTFLERNFAQHFSANIEYTFLFQVFFVPSLLFYRIKFQISRQEKKDPKESNLLPRLATLKSDSRHCLAKNQAKKNTIRRKSIVTFDASRCLLNHWQGTRVCIVLYNTQSLHLGRWIN